MKFNEIFDYCSNKGLRICLEKLKTCPFRELHNNAYFCSFGNFLLDFYLEGRYQKDINHYLVGVCSNIRREMLEDKRDCEVPKERKDKILNFAKIDDVVFCIPECDDVTLLEKSVGISKMCCYRNSSGIEHLVHPQYLNIISKGNNFATLITRQSDEILEFRARKFGFRVEKERSKDKIIYKFFGDSQQEVDDFINDYCTRQK